MAKRSDFAQKLLDDLRLRKERMAASQSQRSTQSNQLPIDAYAYSKQTYRGCRNVKASEAATSINGDTPRRPSSRSHRTTNIGEASDQIIVYGRGQSSVQLSDISLALAYAFDNGGKLRRADSSLTSSIMGFLHQIKRGTMEYGKTGRGSNLDMQLAPANHFPTFSTGQINEISKGVQKLNQILRACSNGGLNMDRYSIEFAKELLQGAMDLEESLRMLADLQKSSDSMKNPQRKNRITLIEDGDENDDDADDRTTITTEQRQLTPPTFSFDKSSGNSHKLQHVGNSSLMQRPHALTYSKERRCLSKERKDVNIPKLVPHRQSTSSISDDKNLNALSEQKNQPASIKSNTEKARIPNVIAKLMGLDNIPEKAESGNPSQKDSGSTHKIEGTTFKFTVTGSAKKSELKSKRTESLVHPKPQKVIEPVIVPKTQEKELMYGADENFIIRKASSEVAVKNGKALWRELNEIKASKALEQGTMKVEKQQNNSDKMNLNGESGKDVQANGRKQVQETKREQKVKGRNNDFLLNNMLAKLEQCHERSEFDSSLQEEKESIGSVLQPVKKNTNKKETTNQKKSQNNIGIKKSRALLIYGPQEEQHHRESQLQHREKHMLEARLQKWSETALKNSSKPSNDLTNSLKKQSLISQATRFKHNSAENFDVMKPEGFLVHDYNDLIQDEASNVFNVKVKQVNNREPGQITSPRNQQSEPFTGKHGFTVMDQKHVHKLADEKVKNARKKKADSSEKIEEVMTRRNGTMVHSTAQVKQSTILKEARRTTSGSDKFSLSREEKKERVSVLKEVDACIISSNDSVSTIEPLDERQQQHPEAELSTTLHNSDSGKVQGLQESVDLGPRDLYQDVKLVATNDKQHAATSLAADEKFEPCEIAPITINGVHEESIDINYRSRRQDQRISKRRMTEPLTESENCLKWILVTSQPFLNTAEALFKLNIPFGILQGCGVMDNQDEEGRKLILDCSYEVMKRKGIRQELKVHPCSKASISPIKIRSLDDLVRQLNEDMEKLKFYGRNRTSPVNFEDYLPKMLENDVYNRYPDKDCMWDLSWNQETFAFLEKCDVTRDMEKHILNGLLGEITRELLNVQGGLH